MSIPTATPTKSRPTTPRILRSSRSVELLGNRLDLLVEADDFPRASVVRYTVAPGFSAPPQLHHHVSDDVLMVVLAGALVLTGVEGDVQAGPGEVVVLQHGTPFAWRNASEIQPAVYLGIYAPGGFEQYFPAIQAAASAAGGLTSEVLVPLWEQYGIAVSGTD